MRGSADATRQRIVQAAYELFYKQGYMRTSVDVIARNSGLTKRTLYYHFRSKDDLLASVFDLHRGLALKRIGDWSSSLSGDVNQLLDDLFSQLASWASKPRWAGAGFTRIVMELADLPGHPAHAIARRHKAEVEAWLVARFAERTIVDADFKAREVMLLLEGCLALLLIHGNKSYAAAAASAAKAIVNQPAECTMSPLPSNSSYGPSTRFDGLDGTASGSSSGEQVPQYRGSPAMPRQAVGHRRLP